jgi:hypothetical protein
MLDLNLTGLSPTLGLVHVHLNPNIPSLGEIEETANNTAGVLDLPPFRPTGSADSFFDIFFRVEVGGQTFYTLVPKRMSSRITHKPPGPTDIYQNPERIPLVTAQGQPTGYYLGAGQYQPRPPVEVDVSEYTIGALVLGRPDGTEETLAVTGPMRVSVYFEGATEGSANDDDGDGRDEVRTKMLELSLRGVSPTLGPIHVRLNPGLLALGEIEETANNTPGTLDVPPFASTGGADSFFDVYFEVEVGGQTFQAAQPKRMSSLITRKPPGPADVYVNPDNTPLLTVFGFPTGYYLGKTRHTPNPQLETDHFENATAQVELCLPTGQTEALTLTGPMTMQVFIGPAGQSGDADGDGRDQVSVLMTQLKLTGVSPTLGPVQLGLRDPGQHPFQSSRGELEEQANATPGILDVKPFAATGRCDSFFDVFLEVQAGAVVMHHHQPKRIQTVTDFKPAGLGTTYEGATPVALFDQDEHPTGILLCPLRLVPRPIPPTTVTIQMAGSDAVQVCWPDDGGNWALFQTADLAPPIRWEPVNLPVVVLPDGRRCVTITNLSRPGFYRLCSGCP